MPGYNTKVFGWKDSPYGKKITVAKKDGKKWDMDVDESCELIEIKEGEIYWLETRKKENSTYPILIALKAPQDKPQRPGSKFQPYDPRQFVSNVVGNAAAAGYIKDPTEIKRWTEEAWLAVSALGGEVELKPETPKPWIVDQSDELEKEYRGCLKGIQVMLDSGYMAQEGADIELHDIEKWYNLKDIAHLKAQHEGLQVRYKERRDSDKEQEIF